MTSSLELEKRFALVTGASQGIGKEIALGLANKGCNLVLHGRNENNLALLKETIKTKYPHLECIYQKVDVLEEKNILKSLGEILSEYKNIDILVNNAGIYQCQPLLNHTTELWQNIIAVNLTSAFIYTRELLPGMLANSWGRIINIASISGKQAEINASAYSASKFALIGLSQATALETAGKGITVNAICPGWVKTEMSINQLTNIEWCKQNAISPEESLENARFSIPQMRFIEAEEVASLVLFLCSKQAQSITGQSINICGGMCLS